MCARVCSVSNVDPPDLCAHIVLSRHVTSVIFSFQLAWCAQRITDAASKQDAASQWHKQVVRNKCITVFTRFRHLTVSWARSIQSAPTYVISVRCTLSVPSLLLLEPLDLFPSGPSTKILYVCLFHSFHMLHPSPSPPWFCDPNNMNFLWVSSYKYGGGTDLGDYKIFLLQHFLFSFLSVFIFCYCTLLWFSRAEVFNDSLLSL